MFLSFFTNWLIQWKIPRLLPTLKHYNLHLLPFILPSVLQWRRRSFSYTSQVISQVFWIQFLFTASGISYYWLSTLSLFSLSSGFFISAFKHIQDLPIVKNFPSYLYLPPATILSFLLFIAQLLRVFYACCIILTSYSFLNLQRSGHSSETALSHQWPPCC